MDENTKILLRSYHVKDIQTELTQYLPRRWDITVGDDAYLSADNKKSLDRIRDNETIQSFITDDIRFKIVPVSRRSFKTELAKRIMVHKCLTNWSKSYFYGLPTFGQAKRTVWQDFKNMFPQYFIKHISESELKIYLINGTELSIIGFDAPQRFEGKLWHGGILDEFADFKDGIWEYHIYPALSDTNGWCILIGTPEGTANDFYRLYEAVLRTPDRYTDYKIYHWNRADLIDSTVLEKIRLQIPDERAYRQEILGEFVELAGRIYRSYDVDKHEDKSNQYHVELSLPIYLCLDFNKSCVYELAQPQGDLLYVFDEIYIQNTDITEMNNEIKARLINLCGGNERIAKDLDLVFYGDYTSEARRDVSVPKLTGSAWQQIEIEFKSNGWRYDRRTLKNPHVMDRINAVNFKLAQNKIIHSTKCQELKKDFLNIQYGSDPDKSRTHASDGLGYCVHSEWPLTWY